jgi:hypothetical protein
VEEFLEFPIGFLRSWVRWNIVTTRPSFFHLIKLYLILVGCISIETAILHSISMIQTYSIWASKPHSILWLIIILQCFMDLEVNRGKSQCETNPRKIQMAGFTAPVLLVKSSYSPLEHRRSNNKSWQPIGGFSRESIQISESQRMSNPCIYIYIYNQLTFSIHSINNIYIYILIYIINICYIYISIYIWYTV